MPQSLSRRNFLTTSAALGAASTLGVSCASQTPSPKFKLCLNTSTIREKNVGIEKEVDITAEAGFEGIEPWMRTIAAYTESGGKLKDLAKRISDQGLTVESAIGFASWINQDDSKRKQGLDDLKRDMEIIRTLGGTRLAAPPFGAQKAEPLDLDIVGERYHAALEVGREMGVTPLLEVWGFSTNLYKLPQTLYAATAAKHDDASLLLDVYHLHKGGSGFSGLSLLCDKAMPVMHLNDYPGNIALADLVDADRVMPGDGDAPLREIIPQLRKINPGMTLSLEIFNPKIWKMDPLEAAKLGFQKMKAVSEY